MKNLFLGMILLSNVVSWAQGAEAPPSPVEQKSYKSKPALAKKALASGKAAVVNKMKDPSSTTFKNLFTRNDWFLCGEVNSKNSFGGYVGFKRFIAQGDIGLVEFDDESNDFNRLWSRDCEGAKLTEIEQILIGK